MKGKIFILGITGGAGSGKSTISKYLKKELDAEVVNTDDFFKSKKDWKGLDPTAIRFKVLYKVLRELKSGKKSYFYPFLKKSGKISKIPKQLSPRKLIIVEGILAFQNKKIRNLLNKGIYLDLPTQLQYLRRKKKYKSEGMGKTFYAFKKFFDETMLPFYKKYVLPLKKYFYVINTNQSPKKIYLEIKKLITSF